MIRVAVLDGGPAPEPGSPDARGLGCLCSHRNPRRPDPEGKRWVNPSCSLHFRWD